MESNAISETKKRVEGALLALAFLLIPVMGVTLAARRWLPSLASEHGAGIDRMISYLMITVGTLFVIGHLVLGYFLWRFSRQDRVTFRLASHKTERKWSLIPVVLMALIAEGGVMVLGLPVWGKYYAAKAPAGAVIVEVTGEQFAWNVRYPGNDGVFGRTDPKLITLDNPLGLDRKDAAARDDIVQLNEISVPVGRTARVRIRSKDTLHSFFLPNLRVKQDAVPGMTIEIGFVPTVEGTYEIACAELCGFGHFQMRGLLHVLPAEKFAEWLKAQQPFF
jgi:cytochrome c oxidase subunit 2